MRLFLQSFILFIVLASHSFASEISKFKILEGSLHSGGWLEISLTDSPHPTETIKILMKYKINKKPLVPVPDQYLQGSDTQELPIIFQDERGYLELEQLGQMDIPEAVVKFLGRVDYEKYSRAMRIQIIPKNGKSLMQFIYHPDIPGMHWDQLKLTLITNLPILGNYLLQGKLQ